MCRQLTGKVALVTGGSRGIGSASARSLAREGADVAISFATLGDQADAVVNDLESEGVRATSFRADQRDPMQVRDLVEAVVDRFGRLDILINNAAVLVSARVDAFRIDMTALDRQLAINFGGVTTTRAARNSRASGIRICSLGPKGRRRDVVVRTRLLGGAS